MSPNTNEFMASTARYFRTNPDHEIELLRVLSYMVKGKAPFHGDLHVYFKEKRGWLKKKKTRVGVSRAKILLHQLKIELAGVEGKRNFGVVEDR